jgi:hypothetical protein
MNVNTKLIMLALAMTAAACGSSKSDPKPVAALVPHFADECPTFTAGVYQQIGEKDKLGAVKMSLRYNAKNLIELKRDDGDFFQVDGTVKTLKDGTAAGGCVKNSIKFNGAKGVQKGAGTLSFDSKGNMVLEGQVAEAGKTGNGGKLTLTRVGDIPTENQPVAAPTTCGNFLGEYVMPETDSLPYKSFTVAAFKVAGGIDTQVEIKTKDDKVTTVTLLKTVPDEPPSIFGECSRRATSVLTN